jgi:hypothetical protein
MAALRSHGMAWAAAALLPIPSLLIVDPASSADVSLLYLGLSCAWLATEILRARVTRVTGAMDLADWNAGLLAVILSIAVNVGLFIALGAVVGVRSNLPLPLLAALTAVPAIGLVPWLLLRLRGQPYAAIMLAAMIVVAAKLAACVVARFVYGPDYIERGYVSADWRTAKLMITLFWSFTVAISALGLLDAQRRTVRLSRMRAARHP